MNKMAEDADDEEERPADVLTRGSSRPHAPPLFFAKLKAKWPGRTSIVW